jgi:hypothetical protein
VAPDVDGGWPLATYRMRLLASSSYEPRPTGLATSRQRPTTY